MHSIKLVQVLNRQAEFIKKNINKSNILEGIFNANKTVIDTIYKLVTKTEYDIQISSLSKYTV